MGFISRRTGSSEDTSIGIVFAGMFALGLVMLSSPFYINTFLELRDTQAPNIEDLLIGEILGVSTGEVYLSLGLALLVIAGLYVFHRHLVYTTFDPVGAEVVGIKTRFVEYVAAYPPRARHRHRHPGRRNRPRHGHAHHPRGNGIPPREAVRRSHGSSER